MASLLVIEDNPADAKTIQIYLEEASFKHKFFHSTSLNEGIQIVHENSVDLVLLDLSLNDSIGFVTLKNYLSEDEASKVPVIVMTGNKNEVVGIQAVRAGAQDFLVKGDFDSKRLVNSIRYSMQRFKAQAKLQETAEQLTIKANRHSEAHQMAKFGNWEMDIVNNAMKWSKEMFRIFGFEQNSIVPSLSDYMDFVHVNDRAKVEAFFGQVIQSGELTRLEHRVLVNGRQLKHLAIQARVNYDKYINKILLIGSIQDVTEHRQTAATAQAPPSVQAAQTKTLIDASQPPTPPISSLRSQLEPTFATLQHYLQLLHKTKLDDEQQEIFDGLQTAAATCACILSRAEDLSPTAPPPDVAEKSSITKILLAEDHPVRRITIKKNLSGQANSLAIDTVADGQEVVDRFTDYDIILMDLEMPKLDGFEAARAIRQHSNVPIIALTEVPSPQEEKECIRIGMNGYFTKSKKVQQLYRKIMELVN